MKYLILLFLIGPCLTEDEINIIKYNLTLAPQNTNGRYNGGVVLTLAKDGGKEKVKLDGGKEKVKLDVGENITIKNCTYKVKEVKEVEEVAEVIKDEICKYEENENGLSLTFTKERASKEVTLEFQGRYGDNGIEKHTTSDDKTVYVANMQKVDASNIFPCRKNTTPQLIVNVEKQGILISNIKHETNESGGVPLNRVIFVFGDIKSLKGKEEEEDDIEAYGMVTSEEPVYLNKFLKEISSKLQKISTILLLTPFDLKIKTRGLISWSDDAMKLTNAAESKDLFPLEKLGYALLRQLYQAEKEAEFLSIALPTFFSIQIAHSCFEGMNAEEAILAEHMERALELDGYNNSKSLGEETKDEKNHGSRYSLLYAKGNFNLSAKGANEGTLTEAESLTKSFITEGVVMMRWLQSICGEEKFIEGAKNHISGKLGHEAFGNCFANVDSAKTFFDDWINEAGYPVLHVKKGSKKDVYDITQEAFTFSGDRKKQQWTFPVKYATNEGQNDEFWLNSSDSQFFINNSGDYFIINHEHEGFYKVNYDASTWKAVTTLLMTNHSRIAANNRALLISDVFSFPRSIKSFSNNIPNYVDALELSKYLDKETDSVPLKAAFKAFEFLDSALTKPLLQDFQGHVRGIVEKLYENIKNLTRVPEIRSWACRLGVENCIKEANEQFDSLLHDKKTVNVTVIEKNTIHLCSAVRNDGARWLKLYVHMIKQSPDTKRDAYIRALSCTRDSKKLNMLLNKIILDTKKEDEFELATRSIVESNPDNINTFLEVIKDLKDDIEKEFNEGSLVGIVKYVLPRLNQESAKTLENLTGYIEDKNIKKEVGQAVVNVKEWTDKKAKGVRDFVQKGKSNTGSETKPITVILIMSALIPIVNYLFNN